MTNDRLAPTSRNSAFTLIELLVVIGIIGLLISILIPTISTVRNKARGVVTQSLINRLDTAIQQYQADFSAFPGTFTNDQISQMQQNHANAPQLTNLQPPFTAPTLELEFWYFNTSTSAWVQDPTPAPRNITSTENMFLALIGGLELVQSPSTFKAKTDTRALANGAISLNPQKPRRYGQYIPIQIAETTAITMPPRYTDPAGWKPGYSTEYDTCIPEFLDGYSQPSPILYMRAMRGTSGIVANRDTNLNSPADPVVPTNEREKRQYNPFHLEAYGFPKPLPATPTDGRVSWADYIKYYPNYPDGLNEGSDPWILYKGDQRYFANIHTAKYGNMSNPTLKPVIDKNEPSNKDTYILISAGLDGKFGTRDDVTNFR